MYDGLDHWNGGGYWQVCGASESNKAPVANERIPQRNMEIIKAMPAFYTQEITKLRTEGANKWRQTEMITMIMNEMK